MANENLKKNWEYVKKNYKSLLDIYRYKYVLVNNEKVEKIIPENVQKLMDERKLARENKDWKKADELRDQIIALGFEVKDK